jgi:hypothetical protein
MESEGAVPTWLADRIEDRCPGFFDEDGGYSAEHPDEGFLTPVRLGFWSYMRIHGLFKPFSPLCNVRQLTIGVRPKHVRDEFST